MAHERHHQREPVVQATRWLRCGSPYPIAIGDETTLDPHRPAEWGRDSGLTPRDGGRREGETRGSGLTGDVNTAPSCVSATPKSRNR